MQRRESCKGAALVSATVPLLSIPGIADAATADRAVQAGTASATSGVRHVLTKRPGTPDHALHTEGQSKTAPGRPWRSRLTPRLNGPPKLGIFNCYRYLQKAVRRL
jgi:hypothetical protein